MPPALASFIGSAAILNSFFVKLCILYSIVAIMIIWYLLCKKKFTRIHDYSKHGIVSVPITSKEVIK